MAALVICSRLTFHTISIFLILVQSGETDVSTAAGITAPGTFMVGGIFPLHEDVNRTDESLAPHVQPCIGLDERVLVMVLTMINAIEVINRSPPLTECNVTLGYQILDSCSDVSTTLRATADLSLQDRCLPGGDATSCRQPVTAVIGAAYSETSIAIARQLTLEMIPQISYSSTAVILSDKSRFPAFIRTIPNDQHQTAAMVSLLKSYGWSYVGIITMDEDYGRSALEHFVNQASEQDICVPIKSILPRSVSSLRAHSAIRQTAQTILNISVVQVIVSFVTPAIMRNLFRELSVQALKATQSTRAMRRVWVAADGWSTSGSARGRLTLQDIGHVVGFTFKSGDLTSISEYLSRLEADQHNNRFLQEFYQQLNHSRGLNHSQLAAEASQLLREHLAGDMVLSIEMAVSAVAQAVASICQHRDCKRAGTVQPWQVLEALRTERFQLGGRSYRFDSNGDINLGYSVTMWRSEGRSVHVHDVVAEYHPLNNSFTHTTHPTNLLFQQLQDVVSKCSNSCLPGQSKKSPQSQHTQYSCCYYCDSCPENHYTNQTDMNECLACDESVEWSPKGSSTCFTKELLFFGWRDGFAMLLLIFCVLGIILTLLVSAVFLHHRHTLVVRAAGGPLSQAILYSLVASYVSAMLFVGRPSSFQCKARQVLFGISFTLCVSCILVKTLKILSAFQCNPESKQLLRRLYQPHAIVSICVAVQVAICICWLVLKSPGYHRVTNPTTLHEKCHEGSYVAFGVMLGYIAVLAFVCFICAFIGRKLPNRYNDAKFITFSMLLYLISWLLFIPVYVTTSGVYIPAVEMVVILISNYGILSCHFLIKCYTILFRSDVKIRSALRRDLYRYATDSVLPNLPEPPALPVPPAPHVLHTLPELYGPHALHAPPEPHALHVLHAPPEPHVPHASPEPHVPHAPPEPHVPHAPPEPHVPHASPEPHVPHAPPEPHVPHASPEPHALCAPPEPPAPHASPDSHVLPALPEPHAPPAPLAPRRRISV